MITASLGICQSRRQGESLAPDVPLPPRRSLPFECSSTVEYLPYLQCIW